MQLTKIVATVGPDVLHEEGIAELIRHGVTVFRFNFKHNVPEWHNDGIILVNKVADKMDRPVATMIDLNGPSIRVNMNADKLSIQKGEKLYFGPVVFEKDVKGISLTHPDVIAELDEGQTILADDGTFTFTLSREDEQEYLISQTSGTLLNKKNLNIPGSNFTFPILVDRDFEGLKVAARQEVDYVALSFVRSASDIQKLRDHMKEYNVNAHVISKIETKIALDNLDEIIDETDAIMVARGDLGVETPFEEVPFYQKRMIQKCIEKGKPVITATQMLNTMITEPQPTRAEISDVANAVYDLTDAVMLSGETAFGKYPYESVEVMEKITRFNEQKMTYDIRRRYNLEVEDDEAKICDTAYTLFLNYAHEGQHSIKGFIVFTRSGRTARLVSRYRSRPNCPIFAFTDSDSVRDRLALSYGVKPFNVNSLHGEGTFNQDEIYKVCQFLQEKDYAQKGDSFIVLHGDIWDVEGGTSTVKLITLS